MSTLYIKKLNPADVSQLQTISKETFYETFAHHNTAEDMQHYLDNDFSVETLGQEISSPTSAFYFAMQNNQAIGYLKINLGTVQPGLKDGENVEIERIYVLKAFHRQKIGQFLFKHAVEIAKQIKVKYIWLGVWEKNVQAIHFYKKNGFVEFGTKIFKLGSDEQTDILMRLDLKN